MSGADIYPFIFNGVKISSVLTKSTSETSKSGGYVKLTCTQPFLQLKLYGISSSGWTGGFYNGLLSTTEMATKHTANEYANSCIFIFETNELLLGSDVTDSWVEPFTSAYVSAYARYSSFNTSLWYKIDYSAYPTVYVYGSDSTGKVGTTYTDYIYNFKISYA